MLNPKANRLYHIFGSNRLAKLSAIVLMVLYSSAIFAPVLAPYSYSDEDRSYSYCPPTPIEFLYHGHLSWPFVYGRTFRMDQMHRSIYDKNEQKVYPLRFFKDGHLLGVDTPGRIYLLGADARGRDILSRILYGGRVSLSIGLIGVLISFALGLCVGSIAGYYAGWVDNVLMRICEMIIMVPSFYLMLALRAAVPNSLSSLQIYLSVVIILAFIGWASLARIIRGMVLSLRKRNYVMAARNLGCSDAKIIFRHIIPHTISYCLPALMLSIPSYILAETGLSVLGLGIEDPIPSWGNLLSDAMGIIPIHFAPWILIPGICIFLTIMSFNIVGDALRDTLDPYKELS